VLLFIHLYIFDVLRGPSIACVDNIHVYLMLTSCIWC